MHIQVPYKQSKDKIAAYSKVKSIFTEEYLAKWKVDADIDCADEYPRIIITGSGFRLQVNFEEDSCEAYVELGFKYQLFKSVIEQKIKGELTSKL